MSLGPAAALRRSSAPQLGHARTELAEHVTSRKTWRRMSTGSGIGHSRSTPCISEVVKEKPRRASLMLLDGTLGLAEDFAIEHDSSPRPLAGVLSQASTTPPSSEAGSGLSDDDDDDDTEDAKEESMPSQETYLFKQAADLPSQATESSNVLILVLLLVFCGCACQAPMEVMTGRDKGCAHLISLVEYIFGIIASLGALREKRRLPWALHLGLAGANISYSMLLNVALGSALPTVALLTMKNGNLVANMFLGVLVLGRRYTLQQYLAVLCITMGLVAASWRGGAKSWQGNGETSALIGSVCLVGALLSRAAGGVVQELYCRTQGAPVAELLLYRSLLGLPIILIRWRSISEHAIRWSVEPQISGLAWPTFWALLAANVLFDYACKVFMTRLIGQTSALVGTLALTCQKFISFLISAFAVSSETPGWNLWLSSIAVLTGTVVYSFAPKRLAPPAGDKVKVG
mmetsp:Transcript_112496/g.195199  ORF Transcript_112496/g.195199 Transcript_112496/m.195199 type:complete len:460 (+) Transcript_112496:31-1410(+)